MNLDPALLEILVCPDCRSVLAVDEEASELVCTGCGLAYPVRDDIPVLLVEEARRPAGAAPDDQVTGRQAPDQQA
ncbi:MAG TPA: Trm112 family protein [Nocardioidaceae bacterium]|nr:Trm112 family protein [Nocardioidaceae bacterium]